MFGTRADEFAVLTSFTGQLPRARPATSLFAFIRLAPGRIRAAAD
jgi:hypothetical protein